MRNGTRPAVVYISGPITTGGNVPVNVRKGIEAGVTLMDLGYVVICPHEKAFGMEMLSPRSYEDWMQYDFRCINASDAVYRMPGESVGGDREVAYAADHDIPVFYSLDALVERLPTQVDDWLEQRNIGSTLAARCLLEVAESGRHVGVFSGQVMEAAAQAILKLHRRIPG